MDISNTIKQLVEKIFEDEGLKLNFLKNETVRDLIEESYLTPEFRDFEDFKKLPNENQLGGSGKGFREKDRRKQWTGKNVRDSLSNVDKQKLDDLRSEYNIEIKKTAPSQETLDSLQKQIDELEGTSTTQNQLDRFFFKSDSVPELNGFFNKESNKEKSKDFLVRTFYNKISQSKDSKESLLLLDALFSRDNTNSKSYAAIINLGDLFYPYFENSARVTEEFFNDIEVDKTKKGMYNGIGYLDPAKQRNNHVSVVVSGLSEYVADGLRGIIEDIEFPYLERPEDQENYYRKYFNDDFVNNLASSLSKEYGQDTEIQISFSNFLSSVGYSDEEIGRYQYLFVFPSLDFSECSPELEPEENDSSTDDCQEDFYDLVPADWPRMPTNEIFFDENNCSYVLSFVTDYENTQKLSIKEMKEEYRRQITKNMLDILSLEYSEKELKDLSTMLVYKSYYVNPKPLLKIRLLASISKKKIINLGTTTNQQSAGNTRVISYNIQEMFEDMSSLSDIMKFYEQRMVVDLLRGNALYYTDLNFSKEATSIDEFSLNLSKLIRPIGDYDTIFISFDEDRITGVELRKDGYKKRSITNGLETFATSSPQTRERTINFIRNLSEIIDYFSENKTDTYDVFVNNYFIPQPTKKQTKNNLLNYANGSPEPKGFASLGEISKRSIDFVASEVKRGYTNFSCMDEDEKDEIMKKAYSKEEMAEKKNFGKQFSVSIHDRFFEQAPEIFEKISSGEGEKALNELGTDFLNRLGVCGVGDLVALASSTLLNFLDPQEYLDELVKCAISKLDPKTAQKFYNKVTSSSILNDLNQGTDFLNVYREFVGDTLLPWQITPDQVTGINNLDENLLNLVGTDEYDLRIRAFGDTLVVAFNTEQLLDLLSDVPGGEWIRFFIELSDNVVRQCKIVNNGDGILTNIKIKGQFNNLCEGEKSKFKLPKMPTINKVKSKTIADAIADNAKEIIINLTVKIITFSFRELMKSVTQALSFDANFYAQGPEIPEFLQDGQYFYNIIRESSNKTSVTDTQINEMFLQTLSEMNITGIDGISEETVEGFLTNTSLVLNEKQKIDLLKGGDNYQTRQDILEANERNGLARLLKKDPSRIGDVFEKFGQDANIEMLEDNLSNKIPDSLLNSDFCLEKPENAYSEALKENKGISKEEAEKQQEERLEREKDKLCNFMDMISNPIAPIFGNAISKVLKKDGPIFGLLESEKFELFKYSAEMEYSLLSIPLGQDFNDPRDGFLQLILHGDEGFAYDRIDIKNDTIPSSSSGAYTKFSSDFSANTNFSYSPLVDEDVYFFNPSTAESISLREQKNGLNTVKIGPQKVSEYISSFQNDNKETQNLNKTATSMYEFLQNNIQIDKTIRKDEVIESIIMDNMPLLVERYYGNIKREMLNSKAFEFADWQSVESAMTPEKVSSLMGIEGLIDKDLSFYQLLEPDERIGKRKKLIYEAPFNAVFTKEDYIRISVSIEAMIRSYTIEAMMKSFFSFRTFSENFFENLDLFSNYVTRYMKTDLGENYNLFAKLAMQIYFKKIDLGIIEILNEDAAASFNKVRENLEEFEQDQIEDSDLFVQANLIYIEDLIADFSERTISSTIKDFRKSFSSRNVFLDQFVLGPLIQDGARDVVKNVETSEEFLKIKGGSKPSLSVPLPKSSDYKKTRITIEKFILIEERDALPSSVRTEVEDRPDNLFGVVNLDSWKNYLNTYKEKFSSYNIGQLWKSWKFGLRISYVMPDIIKTEDISLDVRQKSKAYNVLFNLENTTLVPLVSVEKDIENQMINSKIIDEYEISCLIYDLSRKEEYQKLFRDVIDIETLISLITIYSVDNYENYLGLGDKSSSDLNKWQKNPQSFTNIKRSIIEILKDFK